MFDQGALVGRDLYFERSDTRIIKVDRFRDSHRLRSAPPGRKLLPEIRTKPYPLFERVCGYANSGKEPVDQSHYHFCDAIR